MGRRVVGLLAAGLLLLFLVLATTSARQHSPIQHEALYIYVGFQALRHGDLQVGAEHPPLLHQLAALPLLPLGLDDWAEHGGRRRTVHDLMYRFLYENRRPAGEILMAARGPFLALGVVLGLFVFRWARQIYGDAGGLLALGLYVLSPFMLAQTQFTNHDFGLACFCFLALYAFERASERATAARVAAAGLLLGAALLSKYTALLVLPVTLAAGLWDALARRDGALLAALVRRAGLVVAVWAVAGLAVWADYGFAIGPLVLPTHLTMTVPGAGTTYPWVVPAPLFFWGMKAQALHGLAGHLNYLDGTLSDDGWWRYYLMTLLYKVPVPVLILFALRAATALRTTLRERNTGEGRFLLLFPAVLLVVMSAGRAQLGERYILPMFPFVFVWLGGLARPGSLGPGRRLAMGALLAWLAADVLRLHPHHLMYFNQIAGGPRRGWQRLIESHDQGQDLDNLARWVKRRRPPEIHVLCKGCDALPYLDFPNRPLTLGCSLPAGYVAVSVYYRVLLERLCPGSLPLEPIDRIGYSILVYEVPSPNAPTP